MKKCIIVLFGVLIISCFANFASADDYYVISLQKGFHTKVLFSKEKYVKLNICIKQDDRDFEGEVMRKTMEIARKIKRIARQHNWRFYGIAGSSDFQSEIEIKIERSMNMRFRDTLKIKSYIHNCDYRKKYRGGSLDRYLENVLLAAEDCIKVKYFLKK